MAERQSVLTGKNGPAPQRAAKAAEATPAEPNLEAMKAAMAAMQAQIDRLVAELSGSRAETVAARTDAQALVDGLRQQLGTEADTRSQAQADLAGERAASEGLRAQLEAAREAVTAMRASLDQAIAAAGARQPINIPAFDPPAYELEVTGRDVNERAKRIVLKPIKAVS